MPEPNDSELGMPHMGHADPMVERKQRAREYRVAARREKRNRKADEKKQRKLNATILRRMTRNPEKYNKNAERNRIRAIELERRQIYVKAIHQAQNLAAIHDPSGASFNVDPVVRLEDGSVITCDALQRRRERLAEKDALARVKEIAVHPPQEIRRADKSGSQTLHLEDNSASYSRDGLHPDRVHHLQISKDQGPIECRSKKQQKRLAIFEPRPPPPKPTIPIGVLLPEDEEDWLALWDITDDQIERRVLREKKRKASERKALRTRQQSGKLERRAARDEKRKVYRDIKLEWKAIKEEQTKERARLKSLEDEESKKIAVRITTQERQEALALCKTLGLTMESTPGVRDIKPKASGTKGIVLDFDRLEAPSNELDTNSRQSNSTRVNLRDAAPDRHAQYLSTDHLGCAEGDEFIRLDVGNTDQDHTELSYNHKLRRKIRRAIDDAEIRKELLIREQATQFFKEAHGDVPALLKTRTKPLNVRGQRILDNGMLETSKQERVRTRVDLTEFNIQMKILRKQAKDAAIFAGLKLHANLTGRTQQQT